MLIGTEVKLMRKKIKLTQVEFAKRTGVGLRFLRELESNKPTCRMDRVSIVLEFLGFSLGIIPRQEELKNQFNKFSYNMPSKKQIQEKIRQRDNWECQVCKINNDEHINKYGNFLNLHHIDYDKNNPSENNLITLCSKCHGYCGKRREFWKNYFQELLKNKFNI
jgi:transcriptional regulator with XRE-family HTH domain